MFECKTGWNEDGEELVPAGDAFLKDAKAEDLAIGDSNGADDDLFDVSGLLSTRENGHLFIYGRLEGIDGSECCI